MKIANWYSRLVCPNEMDAAMIKLKLIDSLTTQDTLEWMVLEWMVLKDERTVIRSSFIQNIQQHRVIS